MGGFLFKLFFQVSRYPLNSAKEAIELPRWLSCKRLVTPLQFGFGLTGLQKEELFLHSKTEIEGEKTSKRKCRVVMVGWVGRK